jgi:hypothetical protein
MNPMFKTILVIALVAAPAVAQLRDWHSPDTACALLLDIPGLQTRG